MAQGSGTITTGGTAQTMLSNVGARDGFYVQNTSSGDLRVSREGTASATVGVLVPPGALYETPGGMPCSGAVSIWGATTGQAYNWGDW